MKGMVRSEELPVGFAEMVWTQALPVEATMSLAERPAIRVELGVVSGKSTMCQPPPGSCWRGSVGPVKVSKPQCPWMVPVRRMGLGWGLGAG